MEDGFELYKSFQSKYLSYVDLNRKIDEFIDYYKKNLGDNYSIIDDYNKEKLIRKLINKMAIWYELRYPDYEVNKLIPSSIIERINVNEIMFVDNQYLKDLDLSIEQLEWNKFYNFDVFFNSLPLKEKYLILEPSLSGKVSLDSVSSDIYLVLDKDGMILKSSGIFNLTNSSITDEAIIGLSIRDVLELFKESGIVLPNGNEFEMTIKNHDEWVFQKEGILDCVMYKIIECGGKRFGPRRAYLFAKEFGRNLDIPMIFGIDEADPGLITFIEEYLNDGGSKDLVCFVGYFDSNKRKRLNTITIDDLLEKNKVKKLEKSIL